MAKSKNSDGKYSENQEDLSNELFIANAVHEIRTPVQTVIGTLDLLSDTKLTKEQSEYVRQIRYGADVLLALVNDILDFSKLKSHKLTIEELAYDVKTLTENVVHLIALEAFCKKIEVVTDIDYNAIPDFVYGDPTRVQQILLNLLKNAVKFTKKGYIHLELTKKDDFLSFKVTDSGIGIEKGKEKLLFQSFTQGDSSFTRKYGGSGLGLAICKSLVQKMNGKIGVKSNPYGGSIFWFNIPLKPAENSKYPVQWELPVPATTRILIVDDSRLAQKSISRQLNSIGLQYIQTSYNSDDAFLKMQYAEQIGNPFEIVFIDMIMPPGEGWNLASEIKNNQKLKNTKLYMLVPEGQMGRNAKMMISDLFAGYLYKPVRIKNLYHLLSETNNNFFSSNFFEEFDEKEENKLNQKEESEKNLAGELSILVAEDHPVNCEILVRFLTYYGAKIFQAKNGKEAIDAIQNHPEIQMIFMDIQMPILNGIEATELLRKEKYQGIIIACTANNDPATFVQYRQVGINDILIKPFKRDSVKKVLEKWKSIFELPTAKNIKILENAQSTTNDELWDIQDFEDTIGKDWNLGNQIILDYIEQTEKFLKQSREILERKDFEELHRIAHTLKGSSAAISANKLARISAKLSKATKEKNPGVFLKNLIEFEENFDIFILRTNNWNHKC